jgi:hypothetical protein
MPLRLAFISVAEYGKSGYCVLETKGEKSEIPQGRKKQRKEVNSLGSQAEQSTQSWGTSWLQNWFVFCRNSEKEQT